MNANGGIAHLAGQVAVVTGGGSGVGAAIAHALARARMRLALVGRQREALEATVREIEAGGGEAIRIVCEVGNNDSVVAMRQEVVGHFGEPACVVINNAGAHGAFGLIRESDPDDWTRVLQTNLTGTYLVSRAFMADMIAAGWGRIVNVTASSALAEPGIRASAYQLSKGALNIFTRQLAMELDGTGVTVNLLNPGGVREGMWEDIVTGPGKAGLPDDDAGKWTRIVEEPAEDPPEKAAERVLELLTHSQDGINGEMLFVGGGR